MKIGIMTFWWSEDNYGQLLQCYALQKYLRDKGHDAFLIRYDYRRDVKTNIFKKVQKLFNFNKVSEYLFKMIKNTKIQNDQRTNNRNFSDFRNKYLSMSEKYYPDYKSLRHDPPAADVYIVGSDQVWNFSLSDYNNMKKIIHAYMLDFGQTETRRMSYAASWGTNKISENIINEIKPLIKKFKFISVREESGIDLCKLCGIQNAEWVCDPTLLLDKMIYRDLYIKEHLPKIEDHYILLYMLNNQNDCNIDMIYNYAEKKKLKIFYITGNGVIDERKKIYATIPQWLYLIDNAEYVVTNSFHCSVFSIIFNKKFGVIPLTGKSIGMNDRLYSLFKQFQIKDRFIENNDLSIIEEPYSILPNFNTTFDISSKINNME